MKNDLTQKCKSALKKFLSGRGDVVELIKKGDWHTIADYFYRSITDYDNFSDEFSNSCDRYFEFLFISLLHIGINLLEYWPSDELPNRFLVYGDNGEYYKNLNIEIPDNIKIIRNRCFYFIRMDIEVTIHNAKIIEKNAIYINDAENEIHLNSLPEFLGPDCFGEYAIVYLPVDFETFEKSPLMNKIIFDDRCNYKFIDSKGDFRRGRIKEG